MRHGRAIPNAIITVGLLALAACGGSDSDSDSAAPATSLAAEPAASPGSSSPTSSGTSPAASPGTSLGTSPGTSPGTSASASAGSDAPEALRFTAPLVGGGSLDLTSLAGPPVLLWFWAPY